MKIEKSCKICSNKLNCHYYRTHIKEIKIILNLNDLVDIVVKDNESWNDAKETAYTLYKNIIEIIDFKLALYCRYYKQIPTERIKEVLED